jgi:hypothetical protein
MVLSDMFGARTPGVSDDGYLQVVNDGNMVIAAVVSNDGVQLGSIPEIYDGYSTTYYGVAATATGNKYITIDLLRKVTQAVVTVYYSVAVGASAGTCTATLQHSNDNSTWTDVSNTSGVSTVTEEFQNYSAQLDLLRYLRLKLNVAGSGGGTSSARFYSVRVAKG